MSKRNVPISSLLDSPSEESSHVVLSRSTSPKQAPEHSDSTLPLSSLVSKFRTTINVSPSPGGTSPEPIKHTIIINDDTDDVQMVGKSSKPKSNAGRKPIAIRPSPFPVLIPKPNNSGSLSPGPSQGSPSHQTPTLASSAGKNTAGQGVKLLPSSVPTEQLKKFQTSFQVAPSAGSSFSTSKTSINSIINIDDEPEIVALEPTPTPVPATPNASVTPAPAPKKKRGPQKKKVDDPNKKRKTDDTKSKAGEGKAETGAKKGPKGKKKTPEVPATASATPSVSTEYEKLPIHPGMTTDKAAIKNPHIQLPAPTVIDLLNPMREDEPNYSYVEDAQIKEEPKDEKKDEKKEDKKEEKKEEKIEPPPIIALNIPLIDPKDPKPGQSEVVINVLRLSEEKYGWSVIHPKAKSAIDIMDDMIDDDEDGADEDDDEEVIVDEERSAGLPPSSSNGTKSKKKDEELTEEQKVRQHEVKMNRKVGKYDYEDPFIDDEELQMEEEITSTKEGFFVYWGPLVDDRNLTNATANKKGSSKAKK